MSGSSPSMGPTAQPYANKAYGGVGMADSGLGAGETTSPYTPPPTSAPGATATVPGAATGASPGAAPATSGGGMFWQPTPWMGVPYSQSYGGQPAPFDNLHTQILNTLRMGDAGAGRFNANAAARYGYQGGTQQWRPDATPWGQQIPSYQWNPYNPFGGMGRTGGLPYGMGAGGYSGPRTGGADGAPGVLAPGAAPPPGAGPTPGAPPAPAAAPAGARPPINHTANFQQLMRDDPSGRLANEYRTRSGDTINWWQQNRGSLFPDTGALNDFINRSSPQSSNVSPLTMEEMQRLNGMAGIR